MSNAEHPIIPSPRLPPGKTSRTLIAERSAAAEGYDVRAAITMAVRADRRRLGLDQRGYAALKGWSKSQLARLESDPGSIRLVQVLQVLDGTGFGLGVHATVDGPDPDDGGPAAAGVAVEGPPLEAEDWPVAELLARTGAGARFPANKAVRRVGYGGPAWFRRHYECWARPPKGPDWTAERDVSRLAS
jgi:transcriptional regulator with XRE-family HTH domain